jgi:hypothetical protein
MYQQIVTPRTAPVISVPQLCNFARVDVPQQYVTGASPQTETPDWSMYELFISAATDEIESMAATACLQEQVLETYDYFPGQGDPRNILNYQLNLNYTYTATPWWWWGFPTTDSIDLVRRPVIVPSGSPLTNAVSVQYYDTTGALQTLDPSTYTVFADKITLNVGQVWPLTDRHEDCVQITYWAGYDPSNPANVPARLQMAILFLAAHFVDNRSVAAVEPTSEVALTLKRMLQSFRSYRIPR